LDKSAIQRQLLGHIVARATSTPASQTRAPPAYAAVNTDPLGPYLEGLNIVDHNLGSRTTTRKTWKKRTMTFRTPFAPHFAREILFSVLGVYRMLPLPTRAQE